MPSDQGEGQVGALTQEELKRLLDDLNMEVGLPPLNDDRLMEALCPPQLSMEDKSDASGTQKFVAADAELENVTGSFFDVAEKIKEEVKGNRLQLVSCFERLDPEETGTLTVLEAYAGPASRSQALI